MSLSILNVLYAVVYKYLKSLKTLINIFYTQEVAIPRKIITFVKRQKTILALKGISLPKNRQLPLWLKKAKISINAKILDVGCGSGKLLIELYLLGFKNLTGVDPYILRDYIYFEKVKIYQKNIEDINESFDFIMLHHCFEHLEYPDMMLTTLKKILNPGGLILIRIPTVSSFAWRKYKTNWIQLDAPRHFYLHSGRSMNLLASNAGFTIISITYDSTGFQFWGSEFYARDISYADAKNMDHFNYNEICEFNKLAKELNSINDGDQVCYFLKRDNDM